MRTQLYKMATIHKKLTYDILISTIIIIVPYLAFIYLLFDPESNSMSFLGYRIQNSFSSNSLMVWHLMNSLVPLILLILFYINTKDTWKILILFPIGFEFISAVYIVYGSIEFSYFLFSIQGLLVALFSILSTVVFDILIFKNFSHTRLVFRPSKLIVFLGKGRISEIKKRASEVLSLKGKVTNWNYSCQLYLMKRVMFSRIEAAKAAVEITTIFRPSSISKRWIITMSLVVLTFLLFSFMLIPGDAINVDLLGWQIPKFGFKSSKVFVWYFNRKFVYVAMFSIWLISCKQWWKWVMISPILLYSLQLIEIFVGQTIIEEQSNFVLFPIIIMLAFILYLLGSLLRRTQTMIDLDGSLEKEFANIIEELSRSDGLEVGLRSNN